MVSLLLISAKFLRVSISLLSLPNTNVSIFTLEAGYSKVVPVYLDKEGNINKSKSNTVTKEQFEDLRKYTKDIIKQISKEILSGNIEINPYYQKKNKKTPCDYCEYKQICNFKENNNCSYRYIENLKKEEILESIRKEKEE